MTIKKDDNDGFQLRQIQIKTNEPNLDKSRKKNLYIALYFTKKNN